MNSPLGKTFGAKGCISNIGFNFAKFFSNTLVAGVVLEVKLIPGFGVIRVSNGFRNDFNSNYFIPQNSQSDSANATIINANINRNGIQGNSMFYYGIMFSLFPHKAGGIMIQVKRGGGGFQARKEVFGNIYINGGGSDKYPFTITSNWKCELTFKPLAFFRDSYINIQEFKLKDLLKAFSLTLYYERVDFATAEFNGTKFSAFTTNSFMTKYAIDHRGGIKIGFSLY